MTSLSRDAAWFPPTSNVGEWRHLLDERVAIMVESRVPDAERAARAIVERQYRLRREYEYRDVR
jgi:hypothetical protein